MNIKRAQMLAEDCIRHYVPDYKFSFSNGKRLFGYCSYVKKTISLSRTLVALNSEEQVLNMLLHEIAHGLKPLDHHNNAWKETARSIGCDGERLYDHTVTRPQFKYVGTCPNGHSINRYRKRVVSCSKCCPMFNESFLFRWNKIGSDE